MFQTLVSLRRRPRAGVVAVLAVAAAAALAVQSVGPANAEGPGDVELVGGDGCVWFFGELEPDEELVEQVEPGCFGPVPSAPPPGLATVNAVVVQQAVALGEIVTIAAASGSEPDLLGGLDLTGFTVSAKGLIGGPYGIDLIRASNPAAADRGNATFPAKYPNQSYFLADIYQYKLAWKGVGRIPVEKKFVGTAHFEVDGGLVNGRKRIKVTVGN